jgi:hypothetical protein
MAQKRENTICKDLLYVNMAPESSIKKKQIKIPALEYTVHTNTNKKNIFLRQHPIA